MYTDASRANRSATSSVKSKACGQCSRTSWRNSSNKHLKRKKDIRKPILARRRSDYSVEDSRAWMECRNPKEEAKSKETTMIPRREDVTTFTNQPHRLFPVSFQSESKVCFESLYQPDSTSNTLDLCQTFSIDISED